MTYIKTKEVADREQWFTDRIGKKVYRSQVSCPCSVCKIVYVEGLVISDPMHADYLFMCEGELSNNNIPVKYFDTIDERDKYEIVYENRYHPTSNPKE